MKYSTERGDVVTHMNILKQTLIEKLRKKISASVLSMVLSSPIRCRKRITTVEGIENIPDSQAIFAPTHLSDQDMLLAGHSINKQNRSFSMVSQATNFEPFFMRTIMELSGKDRFLPISNRKTKNKIQGSEWVYGINPEDFQGFFQAMEMGNDIIIAGHRPVQDGKFPKKAGLGAIIMAYATGEPLIPVVIDSKVKMQTKVKYLPEIELESLTSQEREIFNKWIGKSNSHKGSFINKKQILEGVFAKMRKDAEKLMNAYKKELPNVLEISK